MEDGCDVTDSGSASPIKISSVLDDCLVGLMAYLGTGIIVVLGVAFGVYYVKIAAGDQPDGRLDAIDACVRFDGVHYRDIVKYGYDYEPEKRSLVAFFPAYPLMTATVVTATGLRVEAALLLVSNVFIALAFVLLAAYVRSPEGVREANNTSEVWGTLLAFGLFPSTFFFRVALAESLFLASAILVLIAIKRRWPLLIAAIIAGAATATRPVGVAVAAAFLWSVVVRPKRRLAVRIGQAILLAPIACWGLLDYMAFQYRMFGNPVAFAQTQENWSHAAPTKHAGVGEKAWALSTLEPIRNVFNPDSTRYWQGSNNDDPLVFNLFFWNPVLFVASAALVAFGAWRRWLTGPEIVLGMGLLAIPYVTRSYEMSMASHARFAAAVVVIYPVMGKILASWPAPLAAAVCALSAVIMMCWTALYVSGHALF